MIRAFEASYDAGPDVEVIDLGTPGLDLTPWLADAHHVVIVDTVKGAARARLATHLRQERPDARSARLRATGPHDPA